MSIPEDSLGPREVEAKLFGSPERQHKLARKSKTALRTELIELLGRHFEALNTTVGPEIHLDIRDEYYDSSDRALDAHDAYFRVRRTGSQQWSITLKTGVRQTSGAIHVRGEFEAVVTEAQLRTLRESQFATAYTFFDLPSGPVAEAARGLLQLRPNIRQLTIHNDRVEMQLTGQLSGKVCIDHVTYVSSDDRIRSSDESGSEIEVEIELASEAEAQYLSPLLDALATLGFAPSGTSKVFRGRRVLEKLRAVSNQEVILTDYAKPERDAGVICESIDWVRYQFKEAERSFEELVILFADLCGSVRFRLENSSGSHLAALVRSRVHNEICKSWIAHCGGQVVKELGDGVLGVFADKSKTWDAITTGVGILSTVRELREGDGHAPELDNVETKVAIWGGQVLRQGSGPLDVYGTGVDLAARLLTVAKPGQLLVSEDLVQLVLPRLAKVKDCCVSDLESQVTKEGRELRFRRLSPQRW